jgi:hypothetical protein
MTIRTDVVVGSDGIEQIEQEECVCRQTDLIVKTVEGHDADGRSCRSWQRL